MGATGSRTKNSIQYLKNNYDDAQWKLMWPIHKQKCADKHFMKELTLYFSSNAVKFFCSTASEFL